MKTVLGGRRGKPHSCDLGFIVQTHSAFQGATGGTSRFALLHVTCYMLHVTLRPPHFPRLFTPQRTQCKGYSKYAHKVHIALLCDIFLRDKKSWKIFVILFGGIKNSPYLCRRFSGTTGEASLRASSRLRSLAKSLHPATRPAERLHRGAATGIPTTEARDKQIAASVLSYHRQGPLLREGQERTKGEERACV